MTRVWKTSLVVMGIITFVLMIAAGVLFWRGSLQEIFNSGPKLHAFVQVPPLAELGQEVRLSVTVENDGENIATIDEIRLPAQLTDAAVIEDVFPSLYPGNQQFYGETTGYKIGLMLEAGERREFVIQLMPWQIADVTSELEVVSGEKVLPVGFRVLFNKPMVKAVVPPTETPVPPTPTEAPTAIPTETPTATPVAVPFEAVVKLIAKVKYSSLLRNVWSGSGTIISPDGLILTNAHLVDPGPRAKADAFVIALTIDPAEPPVEMYFAEPVLVDAKLDLAILKITTDLKFKEVDWKKVKLPTVVLGNSDALQLGDTLTILGYPGIGGETITLTSGNVSGFTKQVGYGERAYIKTAANISGGTSGGLALDASGKMVAIPSQLGSGEQQDVVDCRVIADTNGDGNINDHDMCIPVGGFINALRPIKLAMPLIQTAIELSGRGQ
jgi:S1-C subfamily serine protease